MKNIGRLAVTALIAVFIFSVTGCNMIEKTPEAIAKSMVAEVNGEKITRSDLDKDPNTIQLIAQVKQQYGENYKENEDAVNTIKTQKEQILDDLITNKVVAQKAKELKLLPDETKLKSDMETQIAQLKKQNFNDDAEQFNTALKAQGFTEESFKAMFLSQLRTQQTLEKVTESISKNIKITDKEIEDYYNANKSKYTEQPNKMHLAHILVKTEDEAKKVKKRLDDGEDFAKVAKEVSEDTASKDNGGDLGTVNYDNSGFDADFMAGALALKEGAISEPVKSSFGYHIIKCIKKEEYPVKALSAVKDQIKTQLESDKKNSLVSQKIQEWKKASTITKKEKNII
ncbi:peptidylprolyl isomerase [Clostridium kluyveri]|uniref:peptidylprolyl isomerase n=1 Tax=Clostridium kluyveri TaxID=1534 RepID=UPI00224643E9|nr:peptidylprolyl isomerase [Clostridium kluyveri]UZQ52536.1 peptidylprolyl isomerase [Clostridium kluyveri]